MIIIGVCMIYVCIGRFVNITSYIVTRATYSIRLTCKSLQQVQQVTSSKLESDKYDSGTQQSQSTTCPNRMVSLRLYK